MVLAVKGLLKYFEKIVNITAVRRLNEWIVMRYVQVQPVIVDTRGTGEMQKIIGLAIGLLIAASIIPVALTNVATANTSGWDPTAKTLWPLLSIFGVLGVVMIFLKYVTKK
jgi:hypothetical protein